MHWCAAIYFHACVCKDRMICMSVRGDPESYSCMLIARFMMAACPAVPGQMDAEYGSVAVNSSHASWEAYCGEFICVAVCQQKTAPPLGSTPCLSLSFSSLLAPDPHCYTTNYSCSSTCHLKMAHPTAPPLVTSVLQLQNDKEPEKHFPSSLSLPHSESEYTVSCNAHWKRKKK